MNNFKHIEAGTQIPFGEDCFEITSITPLRINTRMCPHLKEYGKVCKYLDKELEERNVKECGLNLP